jgi:dTMP kinase
MFVSFEGGEGSGKSTAVKAVSDRLAREGYKIFLTREPGGDAISEEIRRIILDKRNTDMDPRTEALLYAAARRQHVVKELLPAIKRGDLILCDRYIDSSLAYQGGARGLGIDNVLNINLFATEGLEPDLTLLFDLEPEIGLKRIAANVGREVNRLDVEKLPFHKKVRAAFHELAARFPKRFVIIDASKSEEEVAEIVYKTIKERLGK